MARFIGAYRKAARRQREAKRALAERAKQARGCAACGLVFGSEAAWQVAHDPSWPGCLPEGAFAQLVQVDGVWCIPDSDAAKR
jgi:hypothetical protein